MRRRNSPIQIRAQTQESFRLEYSTTDNGWIVGLNTTQTLNSDPESDDEPEETRTVERRVFNFEQRSEFEAYLALAVSSNLDTTLQRVEKAGAFRR